MNEDASGGVLGGIRVLDLSAYIAGPYGCALLADMGANVIKVEPPGGDNLRNYPSTLDAECRLFMGANRGKRSIVLDLKAAEGRGVLHRLVAAADVLVHNFRPGVAERLGIGFEEISEQFPRLVYCELSGYGSSGALATRAGFDQVLQTMTGMCIGQAADGAPPEIVHGSVVDYYAASLLALGVTGALYARARSGRGQKVSLSLLGAALCMQSGRFIWSDGEPADADRNLRSAGVNGLFPTREGHIYLSATTPAFWTALCRAVGCEDMCEDPRYDTVRKRAELSQEIRQRLIAALACRTAKEWEDRLGALMPCAVSQGIEAMFEHPQTLAQGHVGTFVHPKVGRYRGFQRPIAFGADADVQVRAAPALGEHTVELLHDAGLHEAQIRRLQAAGVVA